MTARRLPSGGVIDRTQPLTFRFDGRVMCGLKGDTIASALLANGVRIVGRSFKYHRPRGVWGSWVDDPNAIMTIRLGDRELPNVPAATTLLENGMEIRAVNAWPSAKHDVKGGLDLLHRWLGAGFYYKMFMSPDWHLFEPSIRKMAGLGPVNTAVYDDPSDQVNAACDVLVVGGGPAGLLAARLAAERGEDVWLVEDHATLGGTSAQVTAIDGQDPEAWVTAQEAAILAAGGRILRQTTAYGIYDHQMVGLLEKFDFAAAPRRWRLRAGRIVLASGALDRPITFANNDLPGVMSLQGAADFAARYGVLVDRKVVVAARGAPAEHAIALIEQAGARLTRVAPDAPLKAFGYKGAQGIAIGGLRRFADTVLVSGGLTPLVHLWRHAGGKLDWCARRQAFLPGAMPIQMQAIGAANGTYSLHDALEEARAAGTNTPVTRVDTAEEMTPLWPKPNSKGRQWVDFQHDVTLKDVSLAAQENYVSVEHLKRYTTLGMAADQGKTANMAGLAAMAAIQDRPIPEVGTTTFRPPFVPIPIESFHGHYSKQLWHPLKRLPLETAHRALDAALCEYGGWLRPGWYGNGAAQTHIQAEAKQARETVAIFDGSSLGKIAVMGPDAAAFVNFVYYNTITTLQPGRIRYGFMLTEGGIVKDDGVIARLGPEHFLISCSSSHTDSVRLHLEAWRQDGNDPDRIFIHDETQAWATVTVTGPKARGVVETLGLPLDLGREAFPHMSLQTTSWKGQPMRLARVSFTGDLSFEMSVPARHAEALWTSLHDATKAAGGGLLGIEAMSILRAEKGYIMIGKDTDGETMPHDLGFTVPRNKKTAAFIGDRSLHSPVANAADRKQLVGLAVGGDDVIPTGAHVVLTGTRQSQGYVTSSYFSPSLGKPIALAIVAGGTNKMGQDMETWHKDARTSVTICPPCVFDPEGERLNA
ncbi:MAG: 2Fe-2S iron-sulfur cluster-binding protein [Pseudomonadota bacterium]